MVANYLYCRKKDGLCAEHFESLVQVTGQALTTHGAVLVVNNNTFSETKFKAIHQDPYQLLTFWMKQIMCLTLMLKVQVLVTPSARIIKGKFGCEK